MGSLHGYVDATTNDFGRFKPGEVTLKSVRDRDKARVLSLYQVRPEGRDSLRIAVNRSEHVEAGPLHAESQPTAAAE